MRFIDLEYPEMILLRHRKPEEKPEGVRVDSLAADSHLSHSVYVRELARRLGCRDFNEAWDHLSRRSGTAPTPMRSSIVSPRTVRWPAQLSPRGIGGRHYAGEACVHGGGHRRGVGREEERPDSRGHGRLPLRRAARSGRRENGPSEATRVRRRRGWFVAHALDSFDQLDALGYASGMPQPAFYDRLWHATETAPDPNRLPEVRTHAAADIAVEVSRLTRQRNFHPAVTTPDATAAAYEPRTRGLPRPPMAHPRRRSTECEAAS
ncbi:MAG: hypothetical protein U0792_08485 [Gemmataceae bacterium]